MNFACSYPVHDEQDNKQDIIIKKLVLKEKIPLIIKFRGVFLLSATIFAITDTKSAKCIDCDFRNKYIS